MIFTRKRAGIALILLGILFLATEYFLHFTMVNILLLAPLFLIIVGLVTYVWGQKRESNY